MEEFQNLNNFLDKDASGNPWHLCNETVKISSSNSEDQNLVVSLNHNGGAFLNVGIKKLINYHTLINALNPKELNNSNNCLIFHFYNPITHNFFVFNNPRIIIKIQNITFIGQKNAGKLSSISNENFNKLAAQTDDLELRIGIYNHIDGYQIFNIDNHWV